LHTTIKYLRGAVGIYLGTMALYLCGAAGFSPGFTIKNFRRLTSGAAGNVLHTTIKYLRGAVDIDLVTQADRIGPPSVRVCVGLLKSYFSLRAKYFNKKLTRPPSERRLLIVFLHGLIHCKKPWPFRSSQLVKASRVRLECDI
jgi:hypothetical protein